VEKGWPIRKLKEVNVMIDDHLSHAGVDDGVEMHHALTFLILG
jgi:hypothetical protein